MPLYKWKQMRIVFSPLINFSIPQPNIMKRIHNEYITKLRTSSNLGGFILPFLSYDLLFPVYANGASSVSHDTFFIN